MISWHFPFFWTLEFSPSDNGYISSGRAGATGTPSTSESLPLLTVAQGAGESHTFRLPCPGLSQRGLARVKGQEKTECPYPKPSCCSPHLRDLTTAWPHSSRQPLTLLGLTLALPVSRTTPVPTMFWWRASSSLGSRSPVSDVCPFWFLFPSHIFKCTSILLPECLTNNCLACLLTEF